MNDNKPLNYRQTLFVEYYTFGPDTEGNVLKSMIKAGYSQKYAQHYNNRILDNVGIQAAIEAKVQEIRTKTVATRAIRQKFWSDTMHNPKVKMSDRLRASELLGRSEMDFTGLHINLTEKLTHDQFTDEEMAAMKEVAELYVLSKAGRMKGRSLPNHKKDVKAEIVKENDVSDTKTGVGRGDGLLGPDKVPIPVLYMPFF